MTYNMTVAIRQIPFPEPKKRHQKALSCLKRFSQLHIDIIHKEKEAYSMQLKLPAAHFQPLFDDITETNINNFEAFLKETDTAFVTVGILEPGLPYQIRKIGWEILDYKKLSGDDAYLRFTHRSASWVEKHQNRRAGSPPPDYKH